VIKKVAHRLARIYNNFCPLEHFCLASGVPISGLGMYTTVQSSNEFPYYRAGHCHFRQAEGRFATAPEQGRAPASPDGRLDAPRFSGMAGMVGFRLSCFSQAVWFRSISFHHPTSLPFEINL
jgi:hypothetical protein